MKKKFDTAAGREFAVLIMAAVLAGCPSPQDTIDPELPSGESIEEVSTLFVKDSETGIVAFETNDSGYTGSTDTHCGRKEKQSTVRLPIST